jgi:hypothetical protein
MQSARAAAIELPQLTASGFTAAQPVVCNSGQTARSAGEAGTAFA